MPKNDQYLDPSHFSGEHIEKQKQELINAFKEDPADKYPNAIRPAYPTNNRMFSAAQGLTKREYFAGLAMQGLLSNPFYAQIQHDKVVSPDNDDYKIEHILTTRSIQIADELLKQLEK